MSVNIGEQRRKLQSGFRTVQASAVVTLHQCLVSGSPSTSTRRNPAYELLWETICRPDSSAFLAASCADVIVRLVLNGKLDWMDASDDFINAATSASTTAVPYLVRGIADLLVVHLRSIDVRDYTCPFKLSSRRVHPFIGFAKARPDALLDILEQSKRIVSLIPVHQSMERRALLSMLHPWVQYVFVQSALRRLMIHGEFQSLLLDILSECATDAASVVYLVHEVLSLLDRIPLAMDDSGTMHITLLEFAVGHLSGLEKNEGLKVEVLYRCLNHAFDCRQIGRSVLFALAYVRQLLMEEHVILQDCIVSTNLLAASGYLLLQTPEYADEGAVLVELLLHIVKYANLDCRGVQQILPVLFCPLLQALSECTNIRVKNKGYDLLAILERSLEKQGDVQCQQPHRGCSAARGPFGAIVHKTQDLLMQRSQKWNTYSAIPFLNTFLSCSLIFQPSEEVRLAALSAVVSNAELSPDECLSLLPLLLYALRKERSQRVQIHILLKTLPALTSANNPFVTARVLRLAQSLLGDVQAMGAGTIASVGLRCMFEVWKRQPRTWHQFKGYLVAWAKRRRYGRPANWNSHGKWGDELEMELCTTTCFRDVCLLRGEDCGPEILPHLFILLSAPELHPLSAVFALEALNHCIKLDVTDPRAAWNVFMSSYATVATGGAHEDIIIRVCQFFELVPQRDDHSEIYTAFKEDILGRLHPLTSHSAQAVRAAAFAALGKFDPPDLFALLDQPRVLVGSVLSEPDYPGGVSLLLPSLIRHEVKYMRRAVFKGLSVESGVNSRVDESTQVHGALAPLRRMIKSTLDEVRGLWESGRASVGVRSGYAACCLLVPSNTNASLSASEINVKKLPTYRPLTNALRDITLKDHIFVRLEAVPTWIRFWQSLLVWSYQQSESEEFAVEGIEEKQKRLTVVERIFAAVHEDLMVRLKESRLPSLSSNIVLSLTALELAGVAAGLAVANDAAAKTVDFLLEEYVDKGASDANSNTNEVTENDEIQYAVHVALGHLASALHSNDEQRLSSIYTQLLAGSCRVKSTGQDWLQLGSTIGLSLLLKFLVLAVPTGELTRRCFGYLSNLCSSDEASPNAVRGSLIGLATVLPALMQTRDQFADGVERLMKTQVEVLKSFVSEELDLTEQGIAKLEGATWLTSYALAAGWTSAEDSETIVNALHQAVVIAANKRELEASYPVILQSYNRAIRAMATDAPSGIVTTHVENALQTLTTASSSVRFAYLLALSTLVGQHNTGDPNTSVDASLLRRVVEVLYDQLVNGEPKSSRIAGWIFGKIASEMVANEEAQAMEDLIGLSGGGRNMRKDPPNYNRLNQGSSYLRAVFDSLVSGTIHREVCAKLLGCLIHVDAALPAVDWNVVFKVAENMDASEDSTRDQRLCDLCFALATIQAVYGSGSAIEYVISHIATLVREPTASLRILNLPMAIGVLLKLGGLSTESQNTYEARVAVAPSKVIEIFQAAVHRVFGDDDVSSRLRLKFIQTMSPFLRVPVDVAASPRAALLRSMILQELVSGHGYLPEEVVDEDATAAVKELAGCVAFDKQAIQALMTQHFDHNKAALGWTPKGLWCFGKLVEIAVTENKEKPWLADMLAACMKQPSPAMEALLMNVLRQVIASHGVELQQVAVHASISTIQSMLSLDPHGEIGRYIVRMLDIALMICASSDKEAAQPVDVVWSLALGGLNWLWLSMQRGDKEPVPRAFGPVAGSEIVLWLTSLIAEDETTSTRDQVWFKRTYCGASMHMERLIGKITIDRKTSCPPVRVYQIQVEPKQ